MYKEQALVTDRRRREALLEESALMLINPSPWSAPLEEVRLKTK